MLYHQFNSIPITFCLFAILSSILHHTSATNYTTITVVKVIKDAYINGTTYHGEAIAAFNYANSWSVCPSWSNFITAANFTADASFLATGQEDVSIDLSTVAGPGLNADYAFVGLNFYNSTQSLCSGFYCLIVYGPKMSLKLQIAGYEKKESFNLVMPPKTFRKLFNSGHNGSCGTINWRFIQC